MNKFVTDFLSIMPVDELACPVQRYGMTNQFLIEGAIPIINFYTHTHAQLIYLMPSHEFDKYAHISNYFFYEQKNF